jgi:hypothetical protein
MNDKAAVILMALSGGYTAPKEFYDEIKALILEVLPGLVQGEAYTAEDLCGRHFWNGLKKGEPSLAGRCVMDMVLKGIVPLKTVDCEHKYPKRYTLK